jgi:hypothetical protein
MEVVFSIGSAPRLYTEDPRPAEEIITEGVSWDRIEDEWDEMTASSVEIWKTACEEKTWRVIFGVRSSVRLV